MELNAIMLQLEIKEKELLKYEDKLTFFFLQTTGCIRKNPLMSKRHIF